MVNCTLCYGYGKRSYEIANASFSEDCKNCDGTGKIPFVAGWRPFEQSKENLKAATTRATENTCNIHPDCAAADAAQSNGRAIHCWSEDCEECFGY